MLEHTWLKKQDGNTLACRDLGHNWQPATAKRVPTGYLRTLACDSCGAIKTQRLDHTGHILRTSMSYPDGYARPKGAGRLTTDDRATLRVFNIMR